MNALTNMDQVLTFADSLLHTTTDDERRSSVTASLYSLGVARQSRLSYRPEPAGSTLSIPNHTVELEGEVVSIEQFDQSFIFLIQDHCSVFIQDMAQRAAIRTMGPSLGNARFLSYLDAYTCLPPARRTASMEQRVQLISDLDAVFQAEVDGKVREGQEIDDPGERTVWALSLLVFSSRLTLYRARMEGWSLERLQAALAENMGRVGLSRDIDAQAVLNQVRRSFEAERAELWQRHFENVELKWVGTPIDVHVVVVPAAVPEEPVTAQQCGICLFEPASNCSVLTRACGHPYCKVCIESWIHACQANSHCCPTCRAQLFDKPSYQSKQSASESGHMLQIEQLGSEINHMRNLGASMYWLGQELDLHRRVSVMANTDVLRLE